MDHSQSVVGIIPGYIQHLNASFEAPGRSLFGVGIAIGFGIEAGWPSSRSIPIPMMPPRSYPFAIHPWKLMCTV